MFKVKLAEPYNPVDDFIADCDDLVGDVLCIQSLLYVLEHRPAWLVEYPPQAVALCARRLDERTKQYRGQLDWYCCHMVEKLHRAANPASNMAKPPQRLSPI